MNQETTATHQIYLSSRSEVYESARMNADIAGSFKNALKIAWRFYRPQR